MWDGWAIREGSMKVPGHASRPSTLKALCSKARVGRPQVGQPWDFGTELVNPERVLQSVRLPATPFGVRALEMVLPQGCPT